MVFIYILLVMGFSIGLTYLGATIYRRYKDNQLSAGLIETGEDLVGDEWKVEEEQPAPVEVRKCGYQPADKNYQPCTRDAEHEGPCAHEWKRVTTSNLEWVTHNDAYKKYNEFLTDERKDLVKKENKWKEMVYDAREYAESQHRAHDRMAVWLQGKAVWLPTGNQACDFLAMNPKMPIPKPEPTDRERLEMLMAEMNLDYDAVRKIVYDAAARKNQPQGFHHDLVGSVLAEQIRKNAVEKALKEERQKYLAELTKIQEKVADEAFHAKVVSDEKIRLEGEVAGMKKAMDDITNVLQLATAKIKEQAAEIDALKENQKRSQYGYNVTVTDSLAADATNADLEVTQGDGYTIYRTKAGAPKKSTKPKRKFKKTSKRKK